MSESHPFSSSGEEAISRPVVLDSSEVQAAGHIPKSELAEYYEINRTSEEIISGDYKRIALQFPDELLQHSVPIYRLLKQKIGEGRELYVLADTSYGSCCADEVAAQHVDADAILHYGHACMSKTYRLPVIYVFGKKPIDVTDCVQSLVRSLRSSSSEAGRTLLFKHDVAYTHQAEAIVSSLRAALKSDVLYSKMPDRLEPSTATASDSLDGNSKSWGVEHSLVTILYVGPSSLGLTNLIMTHSSTPVHSYGPATRESHLESLRTNKLLMRRYAVVQKARDADVFGILIGTLGISSYLPLISHLRRILKQAHKKSYTISVGKLNPAKLANFMEIECFVLVACPENSLIDSKDFFRSIVTPYELQIALQPEAVWTGEYVLDFDRLLSKDDNSQTHPDRADGMAEDDVSDTNDPDQPVFSLVTGKYRHAKRYGDDHTQPGAIENSSAVILRNQDNTVATLKDSAAGEFLQSRTFRGLETRVGIDAPSVLEQGRSGIARGYADDHHSSEDGQGG